MDVERIEREFGEVMRFRSGEDGEVVVVDNDDEEDGGHRGERDGEKKGEVVDRDGDMDVDVLGEEEEEVPEHEKIRTENNKRIAAYVTRCLRLGLVE